MHREWTTRGIVTVSAFLAAFLAWRLTRPAPRLGDVPYVASRLEVVDRMLELAEVGPEDLLVDLGSGDGRIVIHAASKYGARGRGIEIDPELVRASREAAIERGVEDLVEFVEGDLFETDLQDATAVTMFLLPTVNERLRPRLITELAPGTPVVSHMWDMGPWRPDRRVVVPGERAPEVYQWVVPDGFGGVWEVNGTSDRRRLPGGGFELRLMQRFQELEGELVHNGSSVPLQGRVTGRRARVSTIRPHPDLGAIVLAGTREGARWRGVVTSQGSDVAPSGFEATLPGATVEGVWRFVSAGGLSPLSRTMIWERSGDGWTATLRSSDTDAAGRTSAGQTPAGSPAGAGLDGVREQRMSEVYVWGEGIAFVVGAGEGSVRSTLHYGLIDGDRMLGVAHQAGALVPWAAERLRHP